MVSIIAAMDEKRGIGKGNDLLFRIPQDFERMKALTTGHPIIMGRKTFISIGRKLPNRTNIVITHDPSSLSSLSYQPDIVCSSLEEALVAATSKPGSDDVFIFGGGQVFKEALEKGLADRLYLTIVEGEFEADTLFPDYSMFTNVLSEEESESGGYKYKFLTLGKQS